VICLADNDIIYKLAACDLLDNALAALSLARTDVYVLPTAKYKFRITQRSSAQGERRYGAEVFVRIRDFLASVRELNVPGLPEELQLLAGVDGIDPGEAVLFAGYPLKAGHYVPQWFQAPEAAAASDGHAGRF